MKQQFKLALVLFILGFIGVLSTLSMEFPLPVEARDFINQTFSPWQIKALFLVNPTILLIIGRYFRQHVLQKGQSGTSVDRISIVR